MTQSGVHTGCWHLEVKDCHVSQHTVPVPGFKNYLKGFFVFFFSLSLQFAFHQLAAGITVSCATIHEGYSFTF